MRNIARIILWGWLGTLAGTTAAQTDPAYVLAAAGGIGSLGGGTMSFTVGESFIATVGSSPAFTQGFQQPVVPNNPLPVTLLNFSGEAADGYNLLRWQTAREVQHHYFMLERSTDGRSFTAIGTVYSKAAEGNSTALLSYDYEDRSFSAGLNYYRLRQVDLDGTTAYSGVVRILSTAPKGGWMVYPNPASDRIHIVAGDLQSPASLRILDLAGKELQRMTLLHADTEVSLAQLAAGVYILEYSGPQGTGTIRIVRQP